MTAPVIPDYRGANVSGLVPGLLGPVPPEWLPEALVRARQRVLLVIDGLGWEQLAERRHLAPTLSAMVGGPITTVVPSTTATALASISTGLAPAEHGIVGYRIRVGGEVLNTLRWSTPSGDARRTIVPEVFQPVPPFMGDRPVVVGRADLSSSGFTGAHLSGARYRGWRVPSSLAVEVGRALREGERFVFAYYDGLDKISHACGLGEHFDAELAAIDRLVADMVAVLPAGAALAVTADHGQVHVGEHTIVPPAEVMALCSSQSGEGRFRWLHARPGRADDLLAAARGAHGAVAWVVGIEQVVDECWFGRSLPAAVRSRLGDVALVPFEPVAFHDPADSGAHELIGRHGSLTPAEMLVPLLVAAG